MNPEESHSAIPPEVMAELQRAADDAAKGIRDPLSSSGRTGALVASNQ